MNTRKDLDAIFAALAHPTRRAIIARLAEGEATVNELAAPAKMSLPAVSKHIRVLENAGLVSRRKHAQFRPCQLNPDALKTLSHWAEQYRPIWTQRFDAMDELLQVTKDSQNDR